MDRHPAVSPAPDHDEHFEELAAAAALGSIESADAGLYLPHRAACPRCRDLQNEYTTVASLLPLTLPEASPAPELGARLRRSVRGARDTAPPTFVPPAGLAPPIRVPSRPFVSPLPYLLPLAALLLISIGLGWWNLALREQL